MKKYIIFILLFFPIILFSQEKYIKGVIIDKQTNIPIPFANITINSNLYGVMSDNKGEFKIKYNSDSDTLIISCFDYYLRAIPMNSVKRKIYLTPMTKYLQEVSVQSLSAKGILLQALDSVDRWHKKIDFAYDVENSIELLKNDSVLLSIKSENIFKPVKTLGISSFVDFDNIYHRCFIANSNVNLYFDDLMNENNRYSGFILNSAKVKGIIKRDTLTQFVLQIVKDKDSAEVGYIITGYRTTDDNLANIASRFYIDNHFAITRIEEFCMAKGVFRKEGKLKNTSELTLINLNSSINFIKVGNKYILSNYAVDIQYTKDDNDNDVYEERYIYNVKSHKIKPDKYVIRNSKYFVLRDCLKKIKKNKLNTSLSYREN